MKQAIRSFLLAALIATTWAPGASAASRDVNMAFTVVQWVNAIGIYAGKQVQARGADKDVKAFADSEVDRHTQAGNDLVSYADKAKIEGIDITQEQDDAQVAKVLALVANAQKLANLEGADLDKAFLKVMVAVHDFGLKTIDDSASRLGQTDDAKYLTDLEPALKEDLAKAQDLGKRLGN